MKRLNRLGPSVWLWLAMAWLLSACQPVLMAPEMVSEIEAPLETASLAVPVEPSGQRPDAPPYGVRGPYAVGARDYIIQGDDQEPVYITAWYPALNPTKFKEEITYKINDKHPMFSGLLIAGQAIQNATPDKAHGPYPLVVFAPGLAGWSQANSFLSEHLASHGFVVLAFDPRGETFEEFWAGAATRPLDTNRIIAYADELTVSEDELAGMIDLEHVATAGHSSGGWTALAAGGAQFDFGWCAANPDIVAQHDLSNCTQFVPHQEEIAEMLGLASAPTGMWPPTNDPRVDVVVALAPDGDIWGADYGGVANVAVPTLLVTGSKDTILPPEINAYPIYEHLGSAEKSLITFEQGGHMIFFNQCRDTPWMRDDMFGFCSDPVWDMNRAHDLINHYTTAFLLAELKGDPEAAAALAPEHVTPPGITYETTTYTMADEAEAGLDEAMVEKIEALIERTMAENQIPGFAVGVVKDGEVVYEQGFGVAEVGSDRLVSPQTLFPIASLSKEFTTASIMQLVEQGRVDLDASLTTYLPYFQMVDERYPDITIRHLLANISGLPGYEKSEYDYDRLDTDASALEAQVQAVADLKLTGTPGEADFLYVNRNFDILGEVVAKVSGEPYEVYVQRHILAPLGMEDSTFFMTEVDPDLLASSHWLDGDGEIAFSSRPPDYAQVNTPSGGLISTVGDMNKWARVNLNRGELDGNRILDPSSYETMWTPHAIGGLEQWLGFIGAPFQDWGLGWGLADIEGHQLAWWGGLHIGTNTMLLLAPEDDLGVVTMVNFAPDYSGAPPWYSYDIGYPILLTLLDIEEARAVVEPVLTEEASLGAATLAEIEALVTER